jgi:hypothetical protein
VFCFYLQTEPNKNNETTIADINSDLNLPPDVLKEILKPPKIKNKYRTNSFNQLFFFVTFQVIHSIEY